MSDFKDKIHKIRFPLKLRSKPRRGSLGLHCFPIHLAGLKRPILLRKREEWVKRKLSEGGGEGEERKGRWREGFGPPKNVGVAPPMA